MSETEADADGDSEESFDYIPQASAHSPCAVEGEIVGTRLSINEDAEKTGHNVGVIYEDPTVTEGSAWENRNRPDGFTSVGEYNDTLELSRADPSEDDYAGGVEVTEDAVWEARERLEDAGVNYDEGDFIDGTDFKIAGADGNEVKTYKDDVIGIDVGGGTFDADRVELDEDRVMVWYGGIIGQFLARSLDFNGMVYARYNDNDYLTKGLLQAPLGWREDDVENYDVETTDRGKLAAPKDSGGLGRPPRIARPIVLRDELQDTRAEIRMSWLGDSQQRRSFDGVFVDGEELDLSNAYADGSGYDFPDAVIEDRLDVDDADTVYSMYHGDGWQPQPEGYSVDAEEEDTSGGSFDMGVSTDDTDDGGLSDDEQQFAEMVTEQLTGTGAHPDDEVFLDGSEDLIGLVQHNLSNFGTDDPNVDAIRSFIVENSSHIDS